MKQRGVPRGYGPKGMTPDPPNDDTPDPALIQFIARRNVPCPQCKYNLRGNAQGICPECGYRPRLRVRPREPAAGFHQPVPTHLRIALATLCILGIAICVTVNVTGKHHVLAVLGMMAIGGACLWYALWWVTSPEFSVGAWQLDALGVFLWLSVLASTVLLFLLAT